ncbi:MAG: ROK family protein [Clostridia bacterium]|nr:ROK family protein [Clostridia bacterium]
MKREAIDMQAVKKRNMEVVLDCIRQNKTISRASIAQMTSLTRATVSSLVEELMKKGVICEIGEGESNGGRKPVLLELEKDRSLAIGIDLADEKVIRGYLCNLEACVLEKVEYPYENNYISIFNAAADIIMHLLESANHIGKVLGIGIGAAALVNPQSGEVLFSANFDIKGVQLVQHIAEKFGLPVYIENESNAAAWAEKEYGNGKGFRNVFYLSKGKGIGSGIIINGNIYYGGFYGSGEIGHMMMDSKGLKCSCGAVGCLETLIGQSRILERIKKQTGRTLNITEVIGGYLNGESKIRAVVNYEAEYLGKAIAAASNLLNVESVILGGYITGYGSEFLMTVRKHFYSYIMNYYRDKICVNFAKLGKDAVGVGGAALVLRQIWKMEII